MGSSFTTVSPLFSTSRQPVCLDLKGHISDGSEKVAAADSWFPEVPLRVSPVGLVFPPPWFMCLRHGTAEEWEEAGRGAGRPLRPGTLGHSGWARRPSGPDGLLQRPGGVGGQALSAADLADLWDSLWFLLRMASRARTFPRWRMNGTARTNSGGSHEMTHPHSNSRSF